MIGRTSSQYEIIACLGKMERSIFIKTSPATHASHEVERQPFSAVLA